MDITLKKQLINFNDLEILMEVYTKLATTQLLVSLDEVYDQFRYIWKEESIEFLFSNRDAFEMDEDEFKGIDERLEEFGFIIPSFEHVHDWFDIIRVTYVTSKGDVIHAALVDVW